MKDRIAKEQAQVWMEYSACLQKQVDENIFGQIFSLRQIYIPLRAYYLQWSEKDIRNSKIEPLRQKFNRHKKSKRFVVDLETELDRWLEDAESTYAIRFVTGVSGCGKTCFSLMYTTRHAETVPPNVLYIPLNQLAYKADLLESLDQFFRYLNLSPEHLLAQDEYSRHVLILFDGLDDLVMQDKRKTETVRQFIVEVRNMVQQRQADGVPLKVVITGREASILTIEDEFQDKGQILYILPYYLPKAAKNDYDDPAGLLEKDQRRKWWNRFNSFFELPQQSIPKILEREDLIELTAHPLRNFLVALSFFRGKIDLSSYINQNLFYQDFLDSIYERIEKRSPQGNVIKKETFISILEEIGITVWHGNGQTITLSNLRERCQKEDLLHLLDPFMNITKMEENHLLRPHQQEITCSNEQRFEFCHNSFGEYLIARRFVEVLRIIEKKLKEREKTRDENQAQPNCIKYWVALCGPAPINKSILTFLRNEIRLQKKEKIVNWQTILCLLIEFVLEHGMPMEKVTPRMSYCEEQHQARNTEEALLTTLNACALVTGYTSKIKWPDTKSASEWLAHLKGQRTGLENALVLDCLSLMDFGNCIFFMIDLFGANLDRTILEGALLTWANLFSANLKQAHLEKAYLEEAYLSEANLQGANLEKANLTEAHFKEAHLEGANLVEANLQGAHLKGVHLEGADLANACLEGAHFREAWLIEANLQGANLKKARFLNSHFEGSNLQGAYLEETNLSGAILVNANLLGINQHIPSETTAELLSRTKTLYNAKMDSELQKVIEEKYPWLLKIPEK